MMQVPDLPRGCGSWAILHPETGAVKAEVFDREDAEVCARRGYRVVSMLEHLQSLNKGAAE